MCRWYASDPLSVCLRCAAVVNQNTGALLLHAFCYCIATCILALMQHATKTQHEKREAKAVYQTRRVLRVRLYVFKVTRIIIQLFNLKRRV